MWGLIILVIAAIIVAKKFGYGLKPPKDKDENENNSGKEDE